MSTRPLIFLTSLFLFSTAAFLPFARAQDYGAALQYYLQQDQALSQQMQQTQSGIVNRNMQDPRIQAMYQQHLRAGGTMSFEQFAYSYAATAGFTPDGISRWNQSEQNIRQRDQQAVEQYRRNQQQNAQMLQQQRQEQSDRFARQRGNVLNGTSDFRDPSTGERYNLPYTGAPGTTYYDPRAGQSFYQDQSNEFYRQDPNGYDYELEEEE